MAVRRHALLEDSIRLFGFYRECDDFEKWIKDKEKMLRADDSTDSVETAKRKYEVKFLYYFLLTYWKALGPAGLPWQL